MCKAQSTHPEIVLQDNFVVPDALCNFVSEYKNELPLGVCSFSPPRARYVLIIYTSCVYVCPFSFPCLLFFLFSFPSQHFCALVPGSRGSVFCLPRTSLCISALFFFRLCYFILFIRAFLHVVVSLCRYIYLHFKPSVNSLHSRKFHSCLRPATRCNLVFKNFSDAAWNGGQFYAIALFCRLWRKNIILIDAVRKIYWKIYRVSFWRRWFIEL